MDPPRRRGVELDPETAARLRQLLDPKAAPPAAPVRRAPPPAGARLDLRYALELPPHGSRPILKVQERRIAPGERPARWTNTRLTEESFARFSDLEDLAIGEAILAAITSTASSRPRDVEEAPNEIALSPAATARLLPLVGRTGRLHLVTPRADVPLVWSDDPWMLRLCVNVAPDNSTDPPWDVHGELRSSDLTVRLTEIDALLEGGFAAARGRVAHIDDGGASSWIGMLRTHRTLRITPARRAAFLEELYSQSASPPIDLPRGLALPEAIAPASPRLTVHAPPAAGPIVATLAFAYDGVVVAARRPGKVVFDAARVRLVRRDPDAEAAAGARMTALGAEPLPKNLPTPPPDGAHLAIPPARLPLLVATLVAEGWHVEAAGRTYRKPSAWKLAIRSGVDWLEVDGMIEFGGFAAPLPAVLAALRRNEDTVVLDDGTLGVLPEEWLARHGLVLRLGSLHDGRVRFDASQAMLLDALSAADPRVRVDEAFERTREALAGLAAFEPADPPEGFLGVLRGYQRAGLGWLRALDRAGLGGLLADDMGLGKTVQVLAHLAGRAGPDVMRPSLVVAPRSLVFNWKREAARFAPHLRVLDHTGSERGAPGAHFTFHDLVLTTYGTLRRDADALASIEFDYVVLDEAQAIKNDTSETSRASRRLRAHRRLALSGTPVENHLGELWSIVEFVNPGLLGRASAWKSITDAAPNASAVSLVTRALKPFLLRRTKTEVAPDLPARLEETWVCELEGPERELYEHLRARFRSELLGDATSAREARILEALLRLRQAACHPGLLDPTRRGERSAKLDALLPELRTLRDNGQKALVFSQFRTLLDIARPHIEAEGIACMQLDGTTRDREGMVARFQSDPSACVLLISLKAGGVGLNLTAAEYVFLLDPWWNPAAEAQAIDRAHRIGQTKPVFAYRLIAKDTVEERIADLQQRKRMLADSVIRGDAAPLRDLSIEDLEQLLS